MNRLGHLRRELDQLHEELVQQQQWAAAARQRSQADRAELAQAMAESLKRIEDSRRKLAELKSKGRSRLP